MDRILDHSVNVISFEKNGKYYSMCCAWSMNVDYDKVVNLASEARQKLKKVAPKTIAQAMRISGVNPADISILSIYLRKEYNRND